MSAILASVGAWLTKKLGVFFGAIIYFLVEKLAAFILVKVKDFIYWKRREQKQKEALEKVESDVQEGKPRDEETKKNEEDWLNS